MEAAVYHIEGKITQVSPKNGTDFSLEELRGFVKGHIEVVYLAKNTIMIVNEEGKLQGLSVNPNATKILRDYYKTSDYIVGNVLICDSSLVK